MSADREAAWPLAPPSHLASALSDAAELLRNREHVIVVGHERPDGDAIGSTLGMIHLLRSVGVRCSAYNHDAVPHNLRFLPGSREVVSELPAHPAPDALVVVDCTERHRVGPRLPSALWDLPTVIFDHHKTFDDSDADVFVHCTKAAATAELIYYVGAPLGATLDPDAATCLYTAILTDTGSFRYGSTRPQTLRIAAHLLERDVDPWEIASTVYETQPVDRLRLLGHALQSLEISASGRVAVLSVDQTLLRDLGVGVELTSGFVNYARSIAGVEVAAFSSPNGDGTQRISMRSRGNVDVSTIAERYGGGGHFNAAAFTVDVENGEVVELLDRALTEGEPEPPSE